MDAIIKESLKKSISYPEYRELVSRLVEAKSTTGKEKSDALIDYTMLNDRRMKRWDKTVKIAPEQEAKIKQNTKNETWLIITESWCGDAAHVMPVIQKVADLIPNINVKVVLRDDNEALMDAFLTNGSRSIPKLIMIDNELDKVTQTYGPRPSEASAMVRNYKKEYGNLTPDFKEDLQRWYNKNKGQSIIEDLIKLL